VFLESTLDGLSANIALIDNSGAIVLVNQAWRDFASSNGIAPEFVSEGVSYLGVCDNSRSECSYDAHLFSEGMKNVLSGAMETFTLEYACHSASRQRWFLGRITPFPGGGPKMVVVAHEDITERKLMEIALEESNRKLELMTNEDALTKISNRRHFDTMLAYECNRHARSGSTLSIMMLDIDFFKNFNDTYGHVKGDECLQIVAQTISQCLKRPADLAARYGGEEFVCLLPDTSLIGAVGVAENMRRAVVERAVPHSGSQASDVVTVSIGVLSIRCEPTTTPEQVVHQADELLYQAKRDGRNRIKFKAANDEPYIQHSTSIGALKIVWNKDYLSGNSYIDQQHMDLVAIVNKLLQDVLLCDAGIDVTGQIRDILLHVAKHFSDEEEILRSIGYPEAEAHISEHNRLLQKCSDLLEKNAESGVHSVDILQCIIHDLVLKHMFTEDAKYHSYFKGK
jgi:diguanylate cyclase (GGDEF)-like protein/hemerythrin-like metal-binding protein